MSPTPAPPGAPAGGTVPVQPLPGEELEGELARIGALPLEERAEALTSVREELAAALRRTQD